MVETSNGFDVQTAVEYRADNVWRRGVIAAIGENAKRRMDDSIITAFLVADKDNDIVLKTIDELRHVPESGLPPLWVEALRKGWKILPCSCECGGKYVWQKPRPSGVHENFGCVCHNDPQP
ncbi:MAG: hypothetical protein WCT41_01330 [Candidatus Paceibacterota bacterium]